MAHRFPMGILGPGGLYEAWPHRPGFWPTGLCAAQRCLGGVQHTVATGEEPLTGSSGAQSHCAPPGLLPLCSGWIAALSTMKHDLAVSIIMMVVAGFFTLCAVLSLFLLKRVSGGCCTSCKPKEAPAPGVGTSLLPSPWGMFITTAVASPGSSELQRLPSRLWVGGQTGWGSWWLPWAHALVAPRRVDFPHHSLFLQVHSLYRRTGASFQQAQEEFSQGIFSNRTFRNAASSAAQGAFQGN